MTIDEIIKMLADVRADLEIITPELDISKVKEVYEDILIRIDLIGCELTQNIAKKLKEE